MKTYSLSAFNFRLFLYSALIALCASPSSAGDVRAHQRSAKKNLHNPVGSSNRSDKNTAALFKKGAPKTSPQVKLPLPDFSTAAYKAGVPSKGIPSNGGAEYSRSEPAKNEILPSELD